MKPPKHLRHLACLFVFCTSYALAQDNKTDYELEDGEFLEKTVNGQWVYKTLISNSAFTMKFPADFQPYNAYLKESMPPLVIYNNPDFDPKKFDPYDNKWMIDEDSHMIIRVYDLNNMEVGRIFDEFDAGIRGKTIAEVNVQTFVDDKSVSANLYMRSYYFSFEDIYYWRIDVVGMSKDKVEPLAETFITDFITLKTAK